MSRLVLLHHIALQISPTSLILIFLQYISNKTSINFQLLSILQQGKVNVFNVPQTITILVPESPRHQRSEVNMNPNYPRRQLCNVPMGPNIPGVISHTTYTFWIFTLSKMGYQTGRIGVRIITMWNNGVMTIESINVFRESNE